MQRSNPPDPLLLREQDRLAVRECLTGRARVATEFAAHMRDGDIGGQKRQVLDALRAERLFLYSV